MYRDGAYRPCTETGRTGHVPRRGVSVQELLSLRSQYEATADTMRQLRHRASRDDGETQELRRNVYDAETALRTAAK